MPTGSERGATPVRFQRLVFAAIIIASMAVSACVTGRSVALPGKTQGYALQCPGVRVCIALPQR